MHWDMGSLGQDVFGDDAAFRAYMLRAYGADRKSVNVLMALGLVLWGWMMIVPYYMLGRPWRGLALAGAFLLARVASGWYPTLWPARAAPLLLFAIAWADLNVLLTRYAALARARLGRLEEVAGSDAGSTLEKGLILHKALGDTAGGVKELRKALEMTAGPPVLWSLAGISLCRCGLHGEALQAFERAPDPPPHLARWVRTYRARAERVRAMGRT